MKKYIAPIVSVVIFFLNFLCFWHSDALFNRYFIFGLFPVGISLLLLLAGLVVTSVIFLRHRCTVHCIALAICIMTVVVIFVFPFRSARVALEMELYSKDRYEVVEMVKDGEIVTDHLGNAKLPMGYGRLSSDGGIFVYQNDGEQVISFWVFRGMLSGSVQLIYSSTDESLIYDNETVHPIKRVKKMKDHWYLVDTDY